MTWSKFEKRRAEGWCTVSSAESGRGAEVRVSSRSVFRSRSAVVASSPAWRSVSRFVTRGADPRTRRFVHQRQVGVRKQLERDAHALALAARDAALGRPADGRFGDVAQVEACNDVVHARGAADVRPFSRKA